MGQSEDVRGGEAAVREAARALDRDRYLAALLSPHAARNDLMALAAFMGEMARVPATAHEPAIGDIRLQWWRDTLALPPGEATGNPVADALRHAMRRHSLSPAVLTGVVDAYAALLEPGALAQHGAIDAFSEATQGAGFQLAAQILGNDDRAETQTLMAAAAHAYGRVQLLRALPALVARGRNPLDEGAAIAPILAGAGSQLAEARRLALAAPATIRPALLPLALVEPYLAALEGVGSNVADARAEISPLSRVWRLYKASALGRL
jgi:phytoene synthase